MRGGEGAILFACVGVLIGFFIVLLILALFLMASTWLANKCLPQPASRYYDDDEYDDDDDWASYEQRRRVNRYGRTSTAIPQPSLGWAMLVEFINIVIIGVVNIAMRLALEGVAGNPPAMIGVGCCNLLIDFLILAGMYSAMLPTTFPRACLVTVFVILCRIVLAVIILVPVIMIAGAAAIR